MLHTLECCQTQQYYFSYIIYVYYPIATKLAEVANKYCFQIVSDFGSPSSYNSWDLESEPPFTRFFVYNTLSYKHKSQAKKLQGQQIRQINYLFITRTLTYAPSTNTNTRRICGLIENCEWCEKRREVFENWKSNWKLGNLQKWLQNNCNKCSGRETYHIRYEMLWCYN